MCNLDEDQGFKGKNGHWNLVSIQTRDLIGISQKARGLSARSWEFPGIFGMVFE
jgi:hypothetical protein